MDALKQIKNRTVGAMLTAVIANDALRKAGLEFAKRRLYENLVEKDAHYTHAIRLERYSILANLLHALDRHLSNGLISPNVREKILKVFMGKIVNKANAHIGEAYKEKHHRYPPGFLTISPTKGCNLKCKNCYASSSGRSKDDYLDYDTVSRIIDEKTRFWGSNFTVVSGGEPLMWKSDGKDLIDLCREHSDNYFMIYTNGTLINEKMAARMAEVGNIAPAISVEGYEEDTDLRRGKGVFKKIIKNMGNLRNAGIPFGISTTATKYNAEMLLSDEFVDFFFDEQGAIFGWVFQYMPIGRRATLDLMVTPEQRKWMFEREQYFLNERKVFYPDFWNSGILGEGCLAAGRPGGYFYIDWHGNVTPCVFFPYSTDNIKDIYARGGDLNDAIESSLFHRLRNWQNDYGFHQCGHHVKNWIAPCSIRDHYKNAYATISQTGARPIDKAASEAIKDDLYFKGLTEYDSSFQILTDDLWEQKYIKKGD
jgi:MoaA/NifB/PqqE/SkfB family radical SAM enzyme